MRDSGSVFMGVDIGGTKVAAGLVNGRGEILYKTRVPMDPTSGASALDAVKRAIDAVFAAQPNASVRGIGVTPPGPVDQKSGVVFNPPNLPCWRNYPLGEEIRRLYNFPVVVDNDGNAAALAEALWGAGQGYRCVFYGTLGTGVGTGIIFDGRIWHGRTGAAAEGGHVTIDYNGPRCPCGKQGCIEVLAAGRAIAVRARSKITPGSDAGAMLKLANGDPGKITGEIVGEAWAAGDPLANEVLRETSEMLAIWLGNVIDLLEPDAIVIGGGVGELMSHWFEHMLEVLPKWSINQRCREIPLLLAKYKADAGVAGAAALCVEIREEQASAA